MNRQLYLPIDEASRVADARRQAVELARLSGFDESDRGRVALVATESATNILKHARHGALLVRDIGAGATAGIEILALDEGDGLAQADQAFLDGHSTAGTSGTGLGALARLSDEFDWYAAPEQGTVFRMVLWRERQPPAPGGATIGAACIAMPGETISGDDWGLVEHAEGLTLMVCDGLGHGVEAFRAARAATDLLPRLAGKPVTDLLLEAHGALRPTRGAAVSAATYDRASRLVRFAGVGNVTAYVCDRNSRRQLVCHNGIVGHTLRKLQAFDTVLQPGQWLLLHSDGLSTQWSMGQFPGLEDRHPAVIAAMIFKAYWRKRDDVTVVVLRPDR